MVKLTHPFGIKKYTRSKPLWNPWQLGAALVAWWSAGDLAIGNVVTWPNRIPGGLNPTNATGTQQPVCAATSFNSLYPGVTFDGVDDRLTVAATTGLPTGTSNGELWYIGSFLSSVNAGNALAYGGAAAPNFRQIQRRASASGDNVRVSDGNRTLDFPAGSALGPGHIVGGFFENGVVGLRARLDGVAATGTGTVALTTGTGTFRLGASTGGSPGVFHIGVSAEYLIINGLLSTADRERIEGWGAWKYGLAHLLQDSHPYKQRRPTI